MKWNQKIKAGSLQFVLFIGVVIALLLLTFVTLAHTHSLFGKKTDLFVKTIKSADLGLAAAFDRNMILNDSVVLDLPVDDRIQVQAIREYWGVFEKYTVVATSKKNRFVKSVLAGTARSDQPSALYLQDNQRPMIIVGRAKITGVAFLPKQGIRPGNISGNSFYGNSLVNGRQRESSGQLPRLSPEFRQVVTPLSKNRMQNSSYEALPLSRGLIAKNSFKTTTKIILGDEIVLSGVALSGNILVNANRRIVVDATSQLQDVVLVAPEIIVKNGVTGTFQAIAGKRIAIGKNCRLAYPSALVVNNTEVATENRNNNRNPDLTIGKNTHVKGVIVYLGTTEKQQRFHPQIKIEEQGTIWGEIYCEQNLELKGNVFGSVSTSGFMALESGSIYQNHLFNGTIDSGKLPTQYAGLPLVSNSNYKMEAKWLY